MPTKLISLEIHKIKIRSVPKQLWLEPVKQESRNENELHHNQHEYEQRKHEFKSEHKQQQHEHNKIPQDWISGNLNIDSLLKNSQFQSSHNCLQNVGPLEWIPYNHFSDVRYIGKGGFSTVYSALWSSHSQSKRADPKKVALKRLHNSENICLQFLTEVKKKKRVIEFC